MHVYHICHEVSQAFLVQLLFAVLNSCVSWREVRYPHVRFHCRMMAKRKKHAQDAGKEKSGRRPGRGDGTARECTVTTAGKDVTSCRIARVMSCVVSGGSKDELKRRAGVVNGHNIMLDTGCSRTHDGPRETGVKGTDDRGRSYGSSMCPWGHSAVSSG